MRQLTDDNIDWGKWLGSAAVGALVMYMLDPERGAARRAHTGATLRDMGKQQGDALERVVRSIGEGASYDSARHAASEAVQHTADSAHHLAERGVEAYHSAASTLRDSAARAGSAASHAIEPLLDATRGPWSTSTRSAAVVGGGALGLYALASRSPLALLAGLAGLTLLTRGASNRPIRQLVGGRHRMVDVTRTIHIDASPDKVYELWSNYENFPLFMSNVVEVRDLGNRRSHWVVRGPAGSEFQFNSVLTEQSRPRRLAWRSEPGADIEQSGSVEFQSSRGGTRVTVRMSYVPPAGALGHGLAAMIGSDPESRMEQDLARMKTVIERGAIPSSAAREGGSHGRFLH
ncbi:SRPBCC family protein [Massilia soli]|uniref:SRPBCC family protein n=1 Tax=Massilia soli TaxID=2792854 RepID=A0ABS7SU75_9BURK|nr:SRPBCC family protein [Massilia soli]MBZ2209474.1 SRPBCC family protein [Massilia soli]